MNEVVSEGILDNTIGPTYVNRKASDGVSLSFSYKKLTYVSKDSVYICEMFFFFFGESLSDLKKAC